RDVLQAHGSGGSVSHVDRGAGPRREMLCEPSETRVYQVAAGAGGRANVAPKPQVPSLARMDVCGGMVKLVYTEALKASSPQGECGFDSHSRSQTKANPKQTVHDVRFHSSPLQKREGLRLRDRT